MYPNPASTSFWLIAAEKGIMEVLDVNGKLLKTENITANKQEINLNGFANGTYLVRFTSEKGNVSTGELLIQK